MKFVTAVDLDLDLFMLMSTENFANTENSKV